MAERDAKERDKKRSELRFAAGWTGLNGLLLLLGLYNLSTRDSLEGAQVGIGAVSLVALIVVIGLIRVATLRRQLQDLGG